GLSFDDQGIVTGGIRSEAGNTDDIVAITRRGPDQTRMRVGQTVIVLFAERGGRARLLPHQNNRIELWRNQDEAQLLVLACGKGVVVVIAAPEAAFVRGVVVFAQRAAHSRSN